MSGAGPHAGWIYEGGRVCGVMFVAGDTWTAKQANDCKVKPASATSRFCLIILYSDPLRQVLGRKRRQIIAEYCHLIT